jgi:hypothetical protein
MRNAEARLATLAAALPLVLAGLLVGCASQETLRTNELAVLVAQLPGLYDNQAQARADTAAGHAGAHPAQSLTILRLHAPLVGDQVFLVRETAAGDARRVVSQRIWSIDLTADKHIVAALYQLEEPERWRGGAEDPELFRSLLMRDLHTLPGCELLWQKTAEGFSADGQSTGCRRTSEEDAPYLSQHWRLAGELLAFAELPPGVPPAPATGAAYPGADDPWYRFLRHGNPQ